MSSLTRIDPALRGNPDSKKEVDLLASLIGNVLTSAIEI
jgi:hypothetical protein